MAKQYLIKIVMDYQDNIRPDVDECYMFTTNTRVSGKTVLYNKFIQALKNAIIDWVQSKPRQAEAIVAKYGCGLAYTRTNYERAHEFVLANVTLDVMNNMPRKYLAKYGIKKHNPIQLTVSTCKWSTMLSDDYELDYR